MLKLIYNLKLTINEKTNMVFLIFNTKELVVLYYYTSHASKPGSTFTVQRLIYPLFSAYPHADANDDIVRYFIETIKIHSTYILTNIST